MICNVVDARSNVYDVRCDVAFEPSQNDNSIKGATQFTWGQDMYTYEDLLNTTIVQAIEFARKFGCPMTMYLYDVGALEY